MATRMPREDDAAVADRVDVDPDRVRRARVLAAGADPQPDRRLEEDEVRDDHEREAGPGQDAEVPDRPVEEVAHTREVDVSAAAETPFGTGALW